MFQENQQAQFLYKLWLLPVSVTAGKVPDSIKVLSENKSITDHVTFFKGTLTFCHTNAEGRKNTYDKMMIKKNWGA